MQWGLPRRPQSTLVAQSTKRQVSLPSALPPTLFIGLAIGMLYGRSLGLWFTDGEEITLLLGLTGMATLLAATTHAPIMSTLMICEMTGEYQLLPGLLIACVIASVISRTLHRDSIYRQHTAQHS